MRHFAKFCAALLILSAASVHAAEDIQGDLAFAAGDYRAALRDWSAAAAAGDVSAMSGVGALYDTGHGVPQDFATALSWYRRAAEAGNVSAMFSTAAMYDNGRGTAVDRSEAIHWYSMAAERGNGRAAYDLGVIYRNGDGVARDTKSAVHFFRLAAAAGIQAARPNLAALGQGRTPAPLAAARSQPLPAGPVPAPTDQQADEIGRFQKAALDRSEAGHLSPAASRALLSKLDQDARNGNSLAEYDLGYVYEHGVGVPRDPVKSYVDYLKAATSPDAAVNAVARKGAADLGNRLTPDQHAAARQALLNAP